MYEDWYERLALWATTPRFDAEVNHARRTFFDATGKVHEEDSCFDQRVANFSEYYVLDRVLSSDPEYRTPVSLFLAENEERLDEADVLAFRSFTNTIHGLFLVKKIRKGQVVLKDLFTLEVHRVDEESQLLAFAKGDIIEARLIPWEERLIFGASFNLHPREANKLILAMAKRLRKNEEICDPDARRTRIWHLARIGLVHFRQQRNNLNPPGVKLIYGGL